MAWQDKETSCMKDLRDYFTEEEFLRIVDTIKKSGKTQSRIDRDSLLVRVLFCTGGRISEVLSIRGKDVLLDLNKISMPSLKKENKTAIKLPDIPLSLTKDLIAFVQTYNLSEFKIFRKLNNNPTDKAITPRRARQIVLYWATKAGIIEVGSHKPHPHAFRHSCAITMLDHGADIVQVMHQLDHSNVQTTVTYSKHSNKATRLVYDKAMEGF